MRLVFWVLGGLMVAGGARGQTLGPACALMSQATAAAINGAPVSAGKEQDTPGESNSCTFDGAGNNGTVTVTVNPPSTVIANSDLDVSAVQPQGAVSGLQASMAAAAKMALKKI
jgi:hypothetical protein